MTHGISKSVTEKNKLYRKYLKTPNRKNEETYKKHKNKLNHLVKLAKKNYYEKQFVNYKNNSRMTWKTINEILNRRNEKSTLPDKFIEKVSNKALTNPTAIANNFNKYFINVGPELARQIRIENNEKSFDRYLSGSYVKSMFVEPVTEIEVKIEIDKLNQNKSAGYDELSAKVIKFIGNEICTISSYIQFDIYHWNYSRLFKNSISNSCIQGK